MNKKAHKYRVIRGYYLGINYSTNQEIFVGYAIKESWFDPAFCNQPASEINGFDFDVRSDPTEGRGDVTEKDTKAQAMFCFPIGCHWKI